MKIYTLSDAEWDKKLNLSHYGDFFHTTFWRNRICEYLGGKSKYLFCTNNKKEWLIPCYMESPWSQGFRLGSVGYGGPIPMHLIDDVKGFVVESLMIVKSISDFLQLKCTGITTFPLKGWSLCAQEKNLSYTQIIPLINDADHIFNHVISGNVRTAIRRAEQSNLMVTKIDNKKEIEIAYALLSKTQDRVNALYTTPLSFFSSLLENNQVSLWGIWSDGQIIATSLLLIYNDKAFHLFHGWKKGDTPPGTNQLLIWEMIKHAIASGCSAFNLGESHSETLRIAKKRWGSEDLPILKLSF